MSRRLNDEERELWERLRRTVKPLKSRAAEPKREATAPPPAKTEHKKSRHRPMRAEPPAPALERKPPALAPLEEKTLRRLKRDSTAIDARIDLHGMRQDRAHAALVSFLGNKQAEGARIVIVVTGKGRPESDSRGVLRESVPRWLAGEDFRPLVVGFEEAHRHHGGAGALYVRLRRRRAAARRPLRRA
jgi:DNA-nicking Smr family endonuclease